jgi:hypothetical protein
MPHPALATMTTADGGVDQHEMARRYMTAAELEGNPRVMDIRLGRAQQIRWENPRGTFCR